MARARSRRSVRMNPGRLAAAGRLLSASDALLTVIQPQSASHKTRSLVSRLRAAETLLPYEQSYIQPNKNSAEGLRAWTLFVLYRAVTETPLLPRTRRAFDRDIKSSFQPVLAQGEEVLYQQIRIHAETFLRLCSDLAPAYQRHPSTCGPKPLSSMVQIFYALRLFAQGTASWSCLSVDWSVGRTTIMQTWVPKFCDAVSERIPIPKRPPSTDINAWNERASGFHNLGLSRYENDMRTRGWRSEALAGVKWEALDPIAEVFNGCIMPLALRPRGLPADLSQAFWSWKHGCYAINNVVGFDSNGLVTTAMARLAAKVADSTEFKELQLYRAMRSRDSSTPREKGYPEGFRVIADSGFKQLHWLLTPFSGAWIRVGPNKFRCRVYNFKLSKIRVISENGFGRIEARWTILRSIPFQPKLAGRIAYAFLCLHNYLERFSEPMKRSWLRALTELDVEPTDNA